MSISTMEKHAGENFESITKFTIHLVFCFSREGVMSCNIQNPGWHHHAGGIYNL